MSSRPEPDQAQNPPEVQPHLTPVDAVGTGERTRRPSRRRVDKAGITTRPIELVTSPGDGETVVAGRVEGVEPEPRAAATSGAATFWTDDSVDPVGASTVPDRRRPVRHRASPLDYLPKLSLMPFVVALNFVVFMWLIWTVIAG